MVSPANSALPCNLSRGGRAELVKRSEPFSKANPPLSLGCAALPAKEKVVSSRPLTRRKVVVFEASQPRSVIRTAPFIAREPGSCRGRSVSRTGSGGRANHWPENSPAKEAEENLP